MLKKIAFQSLNYKDLDQFANHDLKRDELKSFYETFDFLDLIHQWPEIVGKKLSPFTSPLRIRHDSLFVITKHSIYSQELSFLSEEIKSEIFKIFPKLKPIIKKIVFQTQESFFAENKNIQTTKTNIDMRPHPQSPKYKLLKQEADRFFADVEDQQIKETLTSLYIQLK